MAVASVVPGALKRMERRFVTASFLPVSLCLAGYVIVWHLVDNRPADLVADWRRLETSGQLIASATFLGAAWFLAGLVSSGWRQIVRLYEGQPLRRLAVWLENSGKEPEWWPQVHGVRWHLDQQQDATTAEIYRRYPPRSSRHLTLPTTIGNILLGAERYALDRYGLDVNLLWPRLYWQLPEEVRSSIDVFKEEHQMPLALSAVSSAFGLLAGGTVVLRGGSVGLFLLVSVVGFGFSYAAYLFSIERAEEYAEQLRTIFDLYRGELAANWSTGPRQHAGERQFFAAAQIFVQSGHQLKTGSPMPVVGQPRTLRGPTTRTGGRFRRRLLLWFVRLRPIRSLARFRLRRFACLAIIVWLLVGATVAWRFHEPVIEGERWVVLPVEPAMPSVSIDGEVDVLLRPCGIRLSAVQIERDLGDPQQVRLQMTTRQSESLAGCSPDSVTVFASD